MARTVDLAALRRYAIAKSLFGFSPTTLAKAVERLGFVQADPIRAPSRAQDLTLRHRVRGYREGDLDRAYARLGIDEDYLLNYGFLPRHVVALAHPRVPRRRWSPATRRRAGIVLDFVRERGEVRPRDVDALFGGARVKNVWGGTSRAATQLLDGLHYRGALRVVGREGGVRIYAPRETAPLPRDDRDPRERAAALLALAIEKYAPVPAASVGSLASMLRYGAPQLAAELRAAAAAAKGSLPHTHAGGVDWVWPDGDEPAAARDDEEVRLLAPFDPIVWDRRRFALFWGWDYRFEAYTPPAKRVRGYYALPLLWRSRVVGWANLSARVEGRRRELDVTTGYIAGAAPREERFRAALDDECERVRAFLRG